MSKHETEKRLAINLTADLRDMISSQQVLTMYREDMRDLNPKALENWVTASFHESSGYTESDRRHATSDTNTSRGIAGAGATRSISSSIAIVLNSLAATPARSVSGATS
jgi:hypothetical protein